MGFHPQSVVSGPDFLDRHDQVHDLTRRLRARLNTLLLAPRRFGKTSLIQETFRRARKEALCLYVDLFTTTDEREVAEAILARLYEATATKAQRAMDWVKDHIDGLEVQITHLPTGVRFELSGRPRQGDGIVGALEALSRAAERKGKPVYIALDEFQRILEWSGAHELLGRMRSVIQTQQEVRYVFSGSKRHVLMGLVEDPSSAFWGQLDVLELTGIPIAEFRTYAKERFVEVGSRLDDEALERVGHWCRDNPKRIQETLQMLLLRGQEPSADDVDATVADLVANTAHMIRSLLDGIRSPYQMRLLRALARVEDEGTVAVYGEQFLREARLGTAAAAQAAVKALTDQGILGADRRFTDPFLKLHLRSSSP